MREILFRGKRKSQDYWIVGDLVRKKDYCSIYFAGVPREVDSETVGQYTGLKDKNGNEIFEGDILSGHLDDLFPAEESRCEVVWHDFGWFIKNNSGIDTADKKWIRRYYKVIGNIYDNPELMEGE